MTRTNKSIRFTALALLSLLLVSCGGPEQNDKNSQAEGQNGPAPSTFGGLLVELESNMGWESVVPAWKKRRDSWVKECNNTSDVITGANLMLEFESMVEWSAVDKRWADVRANWVNDCQSASNNAALANLLITFESYVLWDVVSPNWVNVREDWIKRCHAVD